MSNKNIFQIILVVSLLGMLGSLYYGYFGDLFVNIAAGDLWNRNNAILPCDMCHYIRVAQYPLVFISALALTYKEYAQHIKSVLVLSIVGLFFSTYKYLMELGVVTVSDTGICNPASPASCDNAVEVLGSYITLASLGIISFLICGIGAYYLSLNKNK